MQWDDLRVGGCYKLTWQNVNNMCILLGYDFNAAKNEFQLLPGIVHTSPDRYFVAELLWLGNEENGFQASKEKRALTVQDWWRTFDLLADSEL